VNCIILGTLLLFEVLESRSTLLGSTLLLTEQSPLAVIIESTVRPSRRVVRALIHFNIGSIDIVPSKLLAHLGRLGLAHSSHE
jgi:hypothetical protein